MNDTTAKKIPLIFAAIFFACSVLASSLISRNFTYPFPPAQVSPLSRYTVLDLTGIMFGARRLISDIAWLQLLQYYGSPEKPLDKDTEFQLSWDMTRYLFGAPVEKEVCTKNGCQEHEHYHPVIEGGTYPDLLSYCYRVAGLDPFFSHAYLYGAGALAWNMGRPDEAAKLLHRGIIAMERYQENSTLDLHQPYWQFNLYLSAIIYRKAGELEKMLSLLEVAVQQKDCPNMMKSILANIYQKDKKYVQALKLWMSVYDSNDPSYRVRAERKIFELKEVLKI